MAECIEREATIKHIKEVYCAGCNSYNGVRCRACGTGDAIDMIEDAPAADVAPVVRCKDCVHWDDDPDTYGADYGPKGKCMKSFETMCADDFCSHGERKDGVDG